MVFQRSVKSNIKLDYAFTIISNLNLTHGIWMIYLASKGFSLLQLGILEGVFHITSFLMEVPTGAVADLWGRKISRMAGRVSFMISLMIMFFADSFLMQAVGFAFCAINYNLESGAGDALVYDSLVCLNRQDRFMGVKGRKEFFFQMSGIAAFLIGGYMAVRSYPLLFLISGIIAMVALANAAMMTEPPVGDGEQEETPGGSLIARVLRSIRTQTMDSLGVIRQRPRIAFLILFTELIFTFATSLMLYMQNYWKIAGRTEFYIGIAFAFQSAISGMSSIAAPRVEKRAGERNILIFLPVLLLVCLWGIALTGMEVVFLVLTGGLEGILMVAVSDYINRLIPGKYRATILSFQSMAFSFFMILLFPLMGWIGDARSLKTSFLCAAALASVMYGVYLFILLRGQKAAGVEVSS